MRKIIAIFNQFIIFQEPLATNYHQTVSSSRQVTPTSEQIQVVDTHSYQGASLDKCS